MDEKEYTFVCERDLAKTLEILDTVVIEDDRNSFQIAYIAQVDEDCDIDVQANYNYGWIVNKVDTETYKYNMKKTEEVKDQIKRKQREQYRQSVLQAFNAENGAKLLEDISDDSRDFGESAD